MTRAVPAAALAVAALAAGCGAGRPAGRPAGASPALRVMTVRVPDRLLPASGSATGFAVGGGRALTVAHVLHAVRPVLVAGRRARVLRVDRRLDVALLSIGASAGATARTAAARAGERVTVRVIRSGAVRSVAGTVRRAVTARLRLLRGGVQVRPALELAAAVEPGDSGAPVLDPRGRVVGVVFAQASDGRPLTYALDARALGPVIAR